MEPTSILIDTIRTADLRVARSSGSDSHTDMCVCARVKDASLPGCEDSQIQNPIRIKRAVSAEGHWPKLIIYRVASNAKPPPPLHRILPPSSKCG